MLVKGNLVRLVCMMYLRRGYCPGKVGILILFHNLQFSVSYWARTQPHSCAPINGSVSSIHLKMLLELNSSHLYVLLSFPSLTNSVDWAP